MLNIIFYLSLGITFLTLFYSKILKIFSKNKKLKKRAFFPAITIIIPAHNEEEVIENKIKNTLDIDYKNKKIILIDDASTDNTVKIAKKFPIEIIELKKRGGKVIAMNQGIKKAKTEIIVLTDADALLKKDAIKNLIQYFTENVGGVTANVELENPSAEQKFYQDNENEIRYIESLIDSASSMDGKLCAFKKNLIDKLDEKVAADDFELALQIRKKNYKVIFAKDAVVYETPPIGLIQEFKQKRRRAGNGLQVFLKHLSMVFNPKYGLFGILMIRHFLPLILPLFLIFMTIYLLLNSLKITLILIMLMILVLLISKKLRNIFLHYLIILMAIIFCWFDIIKGVKSATWNRN